MRCDPLPRDFVGDATDIVKCPWCRLDAGRAAVTVEALIDAHGGDALKYPTRGAFEAADEGMLTADCPHCQRPFMIALKPNAGYRLLAVRTAADAALLGGSA